MRTRICLLLIALLLGGTPAMAGDTGEPFTVASATAMNGGFFTGMWSANATDIDVRTLLHGYSPVVWTMQTQFDINPTVVRAVNPFLLENGNKRYEITLQQDLTYNDGTAITARDYVFSILLHASPVIEALGGSITGAMHIAGYEEYASGQASFFAGVRLVDTYTYSVEVDKAYLPFFYELSMLDFGPYPIDVIAPGCKVADDGRGAYIRNADGSATPGLFSQTLLQRTIMDPDTGYLSNPKVSSGPYELVSYDATAREASFRINARFKGDHTGQRPSIQRLRLIQLSPDAMTVALEKGEVQLLNRCVAAQTIDACSSLKMDGKAESSSYPRLGFGFLSFACEQGPTQSEAVRKAVAYSIDARAFCEEYISLNYGMPVHGYYGIGQWMVIMLLNPGVRGDGLEGDPAAWDALSLAELNPYEPDARMAKQLLVDDGWTLNAAGQAFVEGQDTVRHKRVDGELIGLTLRYGKSQGNDAARIIEDMLREPLAALGIALQAEEIPFPQLLEHYYRQRERTYDILYLATNFPSVFDPYPAFNTDDDFDGVLNTTGLRDEKLEALALDMRRTEPGDMLGYCQKWLAFQQRWNEVLPMVPLYSNIYFDFFTPSLKGYFPNEHMNWPSAILYATAE